MQEILKLLMEPIVGLIAETVSELFAELFAEVFLAVARVLYTVFVDVLATLLFEVFFELIGKLFSDFFCATFQGGLGIFSTLISLGGYKAASRSRKRSEPVQKRWWHFNFAKRGRRMISIRLSSIIVWFAFVAALIGLCCVILQMGWDA